MKNLVFSPLRGKSGNIEYLIHVIKKIENQGERMSPDIDGCVEEAFKTLIPER
ncbi:hypothetical protein [Kosmotoga arenicorallina]|uniref:hypothetical protein n=1 Tax=Kosmotoga arenicorallina TaxID=688066 RepID=UPI0013724375|nr:hypothetical protein [Kosmotoga arenicorallina]